MRHMRSTDTFWSLLKESVITQAFITIAAITTTLFLFVAGRDVPTLLQVVDTLVLGFYFGSKMGHSQGKAQAQTEMLDEFSELVVSAAAQPVSGRPPTKVPSK